MIDSSLEARLARLGAQARISELQLEVEQIRAAYPDLFGAKRGRPPGIQRAVKNAGGNGRVRVVATPVEPTPEPPKRKRRGMSDAQRKVMSKSMKKRWRVAKDSGTDLGGRRLS